MQSHNHTHTHIHIANCHRIDAISSIKLIWSSNGCCVGTPRYMCSVCISRVTLCHVYTVCIPLVTIKSIHDVDAHSICIHCIRLCQIHFTDEKTCAYFTCNDIYGVRFGVVPKLLNWNVLCVCVSREAKCKKKIAHRATDRFTLHTTHTRRRKNA